MNNNFKKVESITGQKYMLAPMDPNKDEEYYELSYLGRTIYKMLEEQQPERFSEMRTDKSLFPFIKKHISQWGHNMAEHARNHGITYRNIAEEIEWNNLIEAVGLK